MRGQGTWKRISDGNYLYSWGKTKLAVIHHNFVDTSFPWSSYVRGKYAGVSRTLGEAKRHCERMLLK